MSQVLYDIHPVAFYQLLADRVLATGDPQRIAELARDLRSNADGIREDIAMAADSDPQAEYEALLSRVEQASEGLSIENEEVDA